MAPALALLAKSFLKPLFSRLTQFARLPTSNKGCPWQWLPMVCQYSLTLRTGTTNSSAQIISLSYWLFLTGNQPVNLSSQLPYFRPNDSAQPLFANNYHFFRLDGLSGRDGTRIQHWLHKFHYLERSLIQRRGMPHRHSVQDAAICAGRRRTPDFPKLQRR